MTYGQQPEGQPGSQPSGEGAPPPPPQAPPAYGTGPAPADQGYGGQQGPPAYGQQGDQQQGYGQQQPEQYGQYGAAPAAPWGGEAAPTSRPGTVTGGAVMSIVGGAFALIIGAILAAVGGSPEVLAEAELPSETGSVLAGLGGALAVVGVLVIVFAVFVLRGKAWAAIGLAVLAGIYVVLGVIGLTSGQATGLFGIVYVAVATALVLTPKSRAWYRSKA